jgi:hypothetical protein
VLKVKTAEWSAAGAVLAYSSWIVGDCDSADATQGRYLAWLPFLEPSLEQVEEALRIAIGAVPGTFELFGQLSLLSLGRRLI